MPINSRSIIKERWYCMWNKGKVKAFTLLEALVALALKACGNSRIELDVLPRGAQCKLTGVQNPRFVRGAESTVRQGPLQTVR